MTDWKQKILDATTEFVAKADYVDKLAETVASELKRLEELLEDEVEQCGHIETAFDFGLEKHAKEFGLQRRQGETDADLKRRIAFEIAVNRAEGTIDDIQGLLLNAANIEASQDWDDDDVKVEEPFNQGHFAFFRIEVDLDQVQDIGRSVLEDVITRSKSAGVGFDLKSVGEFGYVGVNSTASDFPEIEGFSDGRYSDV